MGRPPEQHEQLAFDQGSPSSDRELVNSMLMPLINVVIAQAIREVEEERNAKLTEGQAA